MVDALQGAMLLAPRYLPRLSATIGLFTRYGLADFANQQGLDALGKDDDGEEVDAPPPDKARAFRRRLVDLGPAYIKLGQLLSTRPDLIPSSYIAELTTLQDDVGAIPIAEVEQTIESELGGRLSKLFAAFDEEPLGTASLGQVHAAELRDGREVVVKVQRPHVRAALASDVEFFRELARFMTDHTAAGARVDLLGVVQQLERALSDELDYRIEARNAATFRRALAAFPRILVPRVIEAYSTERVLTTERIHGVKIDCVSPLARLDRDFHPLAEELTRAYLQQITIDGHFHADPHPGNVFVVLPREAEPPDDADVKLALIDFGMTARLSEDARDHIVQLLLDLADNRGEDAAQTLIELGTELPSFDRESYVRETAAFIAQHYDLSIGELQAGSVLYELINTSYRLGLKLPAELTLLAKALFNLDAVTRALDPTFSPIPTIRAFANQIATERAKRALNPRRLFQLASESSDLLTALPHRLDRITARLAANEFETQVEVPQLTLMMEALQKVANRVFSGLVLAGLLVASAMLMPYRKALGTAGFLLAGIIGLWMVLSILGTDREKDVE